MNRNDVGGRRDIDDGRKVRQRVIRNLGVNCWISSRRRDSGYAQRITIWRSFSRLIRADNAAAARFIYNNYCLTQGFAQRFCNGPCNDVCRSAWSKRDL